MTDYDININKLFTLFSWNGPSVGFICPRLARSRVRSLTSRSKYLGCVWSESPLLLRHPTSTQTMGLQSIVTLVTCLTCLTCSAAYRDEVPLQKWSPQYFQYRFFPPKTTFKRRMPSYVQVNYSWND